MVLCNFVGYQRAAVVEDIKVKIARGCSFSSHSLDTLPWNLLHIETLPSMSPIMLLIRLYISQLPSQ